MRHPRKPLDKGHTGGMIEPLQEKEPPCPPISTSL
jgi:hypothetical protein